MTIDEAVKASGSLTAFAKGSIKEAGRMLSDKEDLIMAAVVNVSIAPVSGQIKPNVSKISGKINGVLAVTTKRVFFCNNVLGKGTFKQILLKDITSIDSANELIGTAKLRITGITEMFVVDGTKALIASIQKTINEAQF